MAQPGSTRYRRGHVPVHPFHLDLNRLRRIIGMPVPPLRVDSIVMSLHVVADNSKTATGAARSESVCSLADERYER